MLKRTTITIACTVAALAAPATAQAGITLIPDHLHVGGVSRLALHVPNDFDYTSTTKLELRMPPGVNVVSTEAVPGWAVKLRTGGGQVKSVTWTGQGRLGKIGPLQFQDFGLAVTPLTKPGITVPLKVIQTFADGEVESWTGSTIDAYGAPQLRLTQIPGATVPVATTTGSTATGTHVRSSAVAGGNGGRAPTWLAVVALVVGALGLLAGIGGMTAARRAAAQP